MLNVNEIFRSIDGECNAWGQGSLTTFIRLQGCNLSPPCSYCFGVQPGRKKPRLILSSEKNKKIMNVIKGDSLLTFDENKNLVETIVTKVLTRAVDRWLRIKINNIHYFVTEEHPFFTTKGLKKAKDLTIEDEIYHSRFQDKLSFRMKGNKNPIHNEITKAKKIKNTNYKEIGKKISATKISKRKKGWYPKISLNKEEIKLLSSKRMEGTNNPNWKGGKQKNYEELKRKVKNREIVKCESCGAISKNIYNIKKGRGAGLDVHHLDGDKYNDSPANLKVLCESCHYTLHKTGYNFWKSERTDGKQLVAQNGFKIQEIKLFDRYKIAPSIRPRPLKVYNFTCRPYNSYLIDYMWVHNCDTKHAQDPDKIVHELTIPDIIGIINNEDDQNNFIQQKVTITGGEPLFSMQRSC